MRLVIGVLTLLLGACSTFSPPPYSVVSSSDVRTALGKGGAGSIAVGAISDPANFDNACRAVGPIAPPDKLTFGTYIQKALADELKAANLYSDSAPRITLTGKLDSLAFTTRLGPFVYRGWWDIKITLRSSNGKNLSVQEEYWFDTAWIAESACEKTAEAFMPAVQSLIRKIVQAPGFNALIE